MTKVLPATLGWSFGFRRGETAQPPSCRRVSRSRVRRRKGGGEEEESEEEESDEEEEESE